MEDQGARLRVDRPVFEQSTLEIYQRPEDNGGQVMKKLKSAVSNNCKCDPLETVYRTLPIIDWVRTYNLKEFLLKDIVAGCTVAVMNIPQGMAYASLGGVPPIVGIYMAFFPVIVYAIFGTSKHISMGSFAVICLMAGKVVSTYSTLSLTPQQINATLAAGGTVYSPMEVGAAVCMVVAFIQLIMYALQLGVMSTLLSETLINGFTAGAAVSVFTSQVKDLLGLNMPSYNSYFQIIQTYIAIFTNIATVNFAALIISAMTITVLLVNNELLKPWIAKKTIIPVPIEFICVVVGTLVSRYTSVATDYNLKLVGKIPVGIPEPKFPDAGLLATVAPDSVAVGIVSYVVTISMGFIFANRLNYRIDSNQELLAMGLGNFVGGLFSCLPFSASLSRSVIQQTVGGQTQLASLVSASILLFVLLWIAPFFEPLPKAVLASIIVIALKSVLLQALDIRKIWKTSRLEGLVWIATYLAAVIIDITIGLLVGVCASIFVLVVRSLTSYFCILERIPNTDLYVDTSRYAKTEHLPSIQIVHYGGNINFVNRDSFKTKILEAGAQMKIDRIQTPKLNPDLKEEKLYLIMDFSALQYVDPAGAKIVAEVVVQLNKQNITVMLAGMQGSVIDMLEGNDLFNKQNIHYFPSVHDAVIFAQTRPDDPVFTVRL